MRTDNLKKAAASALVLCTLCASAALAADPADWLVIRLTDNAYHDTTPRISGSAVVWSGDDGSDREIFLYQAGFTTQLTYNDTDDTDCEIAGQRVVWQSLDPNDGDHEIYLYDGDTTIRLTDNTTEDISPKVSDSLVVWEHFDGTDWEIACYDGSEVIMLTDNTTDDQAPQLSGSNVVWQSWDGHDWEIYFYDGVETIRITDNLTNDTNPQVSGSNIVWEYLDGSDREIVLLYDGIEITQLTSNGVDDWSPRLSGYNVVWSGGNDWQIYFYNSIDVLRLSTASYNADPDISGSNVVWWNAMNAEVYFCDEAGPINLSNSSFYDWLPRISGSNVVWEAYDGSDYEIYLAARDPDIFLETDALDFGQLDVGSSRTLSLAVSNVGYNDLTISDLALQGASAADFDVYAPATLPLVLPAGESVNLELTCTPSTDGALSAVLEITSDDPDEPVATVELSAEAVAGTTTPDEMLADIVEDFEAAVDAGTLVGSGPGKSADNRLRALENMLLFAALLLDNGLNEQACDVLCSAYRKTDGLDRPGDFVSGPAATELAASLTDLISELGCDCPEPKQLSGRQAQDKPGRAGRR